MGPANHYWERWANHDSVENNTCSSIVRNTLWILLPTHGEYSQTKIFAASTSQNLTHNLEDSREEAPLTNFVRENPEHSSSASLVKVSMVAGETERILVPQWYPFQGEHINGFSLSVWLSLSQSPAILPLAGTVHFPSRFFLHNFSSSSIWTKAFATSPLLGAE